MNRHDHDGDRALCDAIFRALTRDICVQAAVEYRENRNQYIGSRMIDAWIAEHIDDPDDGTGTIIGPAEW